MNSMAPNGSKILKIGLGIGTDGADLLYADSGLAAFMRSDQLNQIPGLIDDDTTI